MPELPEVETIRRGLEEHARGRRVAAVEVRHPAVIAGSVEKFVGEVKGRTLQAFERKGKALAVTLAASDGATPLYLLLRLGMTGQFVVASSSAPLLPHTHVRLVLDGGREELRFRDPRRFGRLRCCTRAELDSILGRLGPDAQQIGATQFLATLRARRGAIKNWLMNQQFLAGLGNIYADEALFAARIHPLTPAGQLSMPAARRLYRAMQGLLARAVELQGTSFRDYVDIEGRAGNFLPRLRVYQRSGEPCRRCGTQIRRLLVAGRSSHFCPRCQPRPRRVARMRGPRKAAVVAAGV